MGPPPQPLPAAAAHVFVPDLAAPALHDEDRHHLDRVLRLQPGQVVTVSDGVGGWRLCSWRAEGVLEATGPVESQAAPDPIVTVAFALTKGDRPEWVVHKLTEVGVDRIVPFRGARSVVRWDVAKAAGQAQRWRRVARQAAMQSRRVRLPEVADVAGFAEVAAAMAATGALAALGGGPVSLEHPGLLVGPEGGWDEGELGWGLPTVGLGSSVLRAETAAVAGGVILCALRDRRLRPPERPLR